MADLSNTTIFGDLIINGSIGGAVRIAYADGDAPHSTTLPVFLDTDTTGEAANVTCIIQGDTSEGSYLDEASPRIYDGNRIVVVKMNATWYCMTIFQQTTDQGDALMPRLIYMDDKSLADTTRSDLTDTTWNVDQAIIKAIKVTTTSTDWDLQIYCDSDETNGMFSTVYVAQSLSGNQVILLDLPYIDNDASKQLHIEFTDNSGSTTATVDIYGVEATV